MRWRSSDGGGRDAPAGLRLGGLASGVHSDVWGPSASSSAVALRLGVWWRDPARGPVTFRVTSAARSPHVMPGVARGSRRDLEEFLLPRGHGRAVLWVAFGACVVRAGLRSGAPGRRGAWPRWVGSARRDTLRFTFSQLALGAGRRAASGVRRPRARQRVASTVLRGFYRRGRVAGGPRAH